MTYRTALDNDLKELHIQIVKMGTLIEKRIDDTINALVSHNVELAREVVVGDKKFNLMEVEIEEKCVSVIATQQPVATDLRDILSILKIVTDLERIADHCADISKITIGLANETYVKPLIDIPLMAKKAKNMLKLTIDCYIDHDVEKGRLVCSLDDEVDRYYFLIYEELQHIIKINPEQIKQCLDFLQIAKYLERMADHSTNIAEWVIYSVEGHRLDGN